VARLFRLLLMAAQAGPRWLRAIFRVGSVKAKADITTAPGTPMEAGMVVQTAEMAATPESVPGSDMAAKARTGPVVRMVANIIAQLVADAVFRGRAGMARMMASIVNAPGAEGAFRGKLKALLKLKALPEAAPPAPAQMRSDTEIAMAAVPETAPPAPAEADMEASAPVMAATPSNGTPEAMTDRASTAPAQMAAEMTDGTPVPAAAANRAGTARMYARISLWREPTQEGNVLKISQVHHAVQDGNKLKIY